MTAPLRFALVPVNPNGDQTNNRPTYAAVLAASPGNDLLERIVRALENASVELWANGYNASARKCDAVINELGGGHG